MVNKKEICRLFRRKYPELYAVVTKKKQKKLFKVILAEIGAVIFFTLSYSGFAQRGITVTYIISAVLVCLALPFAIKPYLLFLTPTRLLKIDRIDIEDALKTNDMSTSGYRVIRTKTEVRTVITALDKRGRIFEYSLSKRAAEAFAKGDIIAVFSGFNIPVNLTHPPKAKRICIKCGGMQYEADDRCIGCSLPIVKLELENEKIVL